MLIAIILILGILTGVADNLLFIKEKKAGKITHILFRDLILTALLHFGIMKYAFGTDNIYSVSAHGGKYVLICSAVCLGVCAVYLLVAFLAKRFPVLEEGEVKNKKGTKAIKIVSTVLFALGMLALTGTFWGIEAFGDLTADQMIINLLSPTEGTDPGVYISAIEGPLLGTMLFTSLFVLFAFSDRKIVKGKNLNKKTTFSLLARRIISLVLAIICFVGSCAFGISQFSLFDLYKSYVYKSNFIENNYVDPDEVTITFPEKKRNLIHIYLESMENTFLSKELGGFCEENLIPHLYELSKEGISFSDRVGALGGFHESTGSGWSVAAMVNMGTGLPMKVPNKQNRYGQENNFLPGATAIGDILKAQGYEQTVMFGASAAFGGLNHYYKSHGDFTIIDHSEAKRRGYISMFYHEFWGYEDDKLYEFAKDELTRLSETGKPFHFVMETADTHAPDGYLSVKAPRPYKDKYANAIRYSQEEAYNFVRWIQEQPFYENTTIFIIGDHLSMAKDFFANLDGIDAYNRSCYNLILNPAPGLEELPEERRFDRVYAPFDIYPTLLASIGVEIEGNRLGIGTNLFSDRPTVFEEFGANYVDQELVKGSPFYNQNILAKPKKEKNKDFEKEKQQEHKKLKGAKENDIMS